MTTILMTVKHHFSAGHRIPGLSGPGQKCTNLHGHTFGVEWSFEVPTLDAADFEFTSAKAILRAWVDTQLDHGYLVAPDDEALLGFLMAGEFKYYIVAPKPTTEAIAALLLDRANELLPEVTCVRVVITEGPHNQAEVLL